VCSSDLGEGTQRSFNQHRQQREVYYARCAAAAAKANEIREYLRQHGR
jgi:hypothetical protein